MLSGSRPGHGGELERSPSTLLVSHTLVSGGRSLVDARRALMEGLRL
jgi:hypothetical protein